MTAWFYLYNGGEILLLILFSATLHELGHLGMLYAFGGRLLSMRVNALGAVMETDRSRLSYLQEFLVVLAGPLANLLTAAVSAVLLGESAALFVGINLVLCLFNLLPIFPLDGGQSLYLAVCWSAGPAAAEWAVQGIGTTCSIVLIGLLLWLMIHSGGSLWLLPVTGGLLGAVWRLWSRNPSYFLK